METILPSAVREEKVSMFNWFKKPPHVEKIDKFSSDDSVMVSLILKKEDGSFWVKLYDKNDPGSAGITVSAGAIHKVAHLINTYEDPYDTIQSRVLH
jgi:hypothetical protein